MSLHPKIIDLTLERMHRLLAALGNPERRLQGVIHIAGTNGKGSTQAMIRAGLEADGDAVHAFTSPHLARFHERIRLAGDLITEEHLAEVLEECEVANGDTPITFFEITWYTGSIYGGIDGAYRYNRNRLNDCLEAIDGKSGFFQDLKQIPIVSLKFEF